MHENVFNLSLLTPTGSRKYINAAERNRFIQAAESAPPADCLFFLTLGWSGARISEVLALTPAAIDLNGGGACLQTLKRRKRGIFRQVPLPPDLLARLDSHFDLSGAQRDIERTSVRLWKWSRTTAWRRVKAVMAVAGIIGLPAMPKGLRHGFGVNAVQSNVPLPLLQKWLGHARIETTAIYLNVIGPDEHAFAARMWTTK
ncbi:MAG TPA: site-specific integrase [Xanthobacteraceae bacterium]|jgi:integrase|nr:site-specific integrase [Xanthobacteraceae bacterium]